MAAFIRMQQARKILDCRGNPAAAVDVLLDCDTTSRAEVPSGASAGAHQFIDLRDNATMQVTKNITTE